MATVESLTARVDRVIALFNARALDLPDGFFDRKTQFVMNGAPFETLLGRAADDPLVLMLARGPAGYRFAIKALQHAIPDARVERGDIEDGGHARRSVRRRGCRLSGHVRGDGKPLDVAVACPRSAWGRTGAVARAEATVEPAVVERSARRGLRTDASQVSRD